MLTLHHLETSRSHRILWLLEELGIPYELKTYKRDPRTRLAPPELKAVHPLGKSPVITDGDLVVAESGAIIEYLAERHGNSVRHEPCWLIPAAGSPEHLQCRFWMHYAEGSLMNWLLMKLVFVSIAKQPMPFFARPIVRALSTKVQTQLIDPNLQTAMTFIESHLECHTWFAGEAISIADFQMSYGVDALVSRGGDTRGFPNLRSYKTRMESRPAYQRALERGGPVMPTL